MLWHSLLSKGTQKVPQPAQRKCKESLTRAALSPKAAAMLVAAQMVLQQNMSVEQQTGLRNWRGLAQQTELQQRVSVAQQMGLQSWRGPAAQQMELQQRVSVAQQMGAATMQARRRAPTV